MSYSNGNILFLVLFLCATVCFVTPAEHEFKPISELPDDIPTCKQTDLNLNECIKTAFQNMMPRIKDGIKELNIPPLDPFELNRTSYQYTTGIVQGRINMRNVRVYGLSNSIVQDVDFNMKERRVRMKMVTFVPNVLVEGAYKADMKFNEVNMTPKGFFNVSMTNVTMTARPSGELYDRDGHTYLRLNRFDTLPEVGDMRIYASGLFPDPTLNEVILEFINQYWRQIYKAMLPETRSTWEPFMINGANEFFAALPFDLILPKE